MAVLPLEPEKNMSRQIAGNAGGSSLRVVDFTRVFDTSPTHIRTNMKNNSPAMRPRGTVAGVSGQVLLP
jgi:hypothetical protein